jgi:hypothetical protein
MKTSRKRRRHRRLGREWLRFETLEPRIVLDSQLATPLADESFNTAGEDLPFEQFASAEAMESYLIDAAVERFQDLFGKRGWYPGPIWFEDPIPLDFTLDSTQRVAEVTSVEMYGTNIQEVGVDEGDLYKSDGNFIYHVTGNQLSIVDISNPKQLQVASRVALEQSPSELYVHGNRLTLIAAQYHPRFLDPPDWGVPVVPLPVLLDGEGETPVWRGNTVAISVYDITKRDGPVLLEQTRIEGVLEETRAIGDRVYVITQRDVGLPHPEMVCETTEPDSDADEEGTHRLAYGTSDVFIGPVEPWFECRWQTQEEYLAAIGDDILDDALPESITLDANGEVLAHGQLLDAEDVFHPGDEKPTNLLTIAVLNVVDDDRGVDAVTGTFTQMIHELYVSQHGIYAAQFSWALGTTSILKFAIGGEGEEIVPVAIGEVAGRPINQFAFDEQDGLLRVATTKGFGDEATSRITVLHEQGGLLEVLGQTEDLAPGELIFSVRFLDESAFVVTFRQIDPLFVVDLSDPADPTIDGELKITGFSNYLQFVQEGFLIGLGRDADPETGRPGLPQLSLFNVRDSLAPSLVDSVLIDSAGSEALHNHHAVSYFPDHQVLVLPFFGRIGLLNRDWWPYRPVTEFHVYQIDPARNEDALRLLGRIRHESQSGRSFVAGEHLFTVTCEEIQSHAILNPGEPLDSLELVPRVDEGDPPDDPLVFVRPDEFSVEPNSTENVLDVLANDFHGAIQVLTAPRISEVTAPSEGGSVEISSDGRQLIYAPAPDFTGTETFTYSTLGQSAEVIVHVEDQPDLVRITLQTADADGRPISSLAVGQPFFVEVLVEDVRELPQGVFSTYLDLQYDAALAETQGEIVAGAEYPNGFSGDASAPGLVDEVGAFAGIKPLGGGTHVLVRIPMVATAPGQLTVATDPADDLPAHAVGIYGSDDEVPAVAIEYGQLAVEVTSGLHNSGQPHDTNADGTVSSIDALVIINVLNDQGPMSTLEMIDAERSARELAPLAAESRSRYYDVNGDQFVTAIDVLLVINELERLYSLAEGESVPRFAPPSPSTQPSDRELVLASEVTAEALLEPADAREAVISRLAADLTSPQELTHDTFFADLFEADT